MTHEESCEVECDRRVGTKRRLCRKEPAYLPGRSIGHRSAEERTEARPERCGDHRSRCSRIEPAAEQQKQAAHQQKRQRRAPKRCRTSPFLKVSAHNAASRFALSSAPGTAIAAST